MPAKTKPKAKPKKIVKPVKKAVAKAVPKAKAPKLACEICGYRIIVDEACGCVEEHILLCCGEPMKKS
jgi:hypothetical protein